MADEIEDDFDETFLDEDEEIASQLLSAQSQELALGVPATPRVETRDAKASGLNLERLLNVVDGVPGGRLVLAGAAVAVVGLGVVCGLIARRKRSGRVEGKGAAPRTAGSTRKPASATSTPKKKAVKGTTAPPAASPARTTNARAAPAAASAAAQPSEPKVAKGLPALPAAKAEAKAAKGLPSLAPSKAAPKPEAAPQSSSQPAAAKAPAKGDGKVVKGLPTLPAAKKKASAAAASSSAPPGAATKAPASQRKSAEGSNNKHTAGPSANAEPAPASSATAVVPAAGAANTSSAAPTMRLPQLSPEQERMAMLVAPNSPKTSKTQSARPNGHKARVAEADAASKPTAATTFESLQSPTRPWVELTEEADDEDAAAREKLAQHDKVAHAKLNADAAPFVPPSSQPSKAPVISSRLLTDDDDAVVNAPPEDGAKAPGGPPASTARAVAAAVDGTDAAASSGEQFDDATSAPDRFSSAAASAQDHFSDPESSPQNVLSSELAAADADADAEDVRPPPDVAEAEAPAGEAEAVVEEEDDEAAPECADDDTETFEHQPFTLVGAAIEPAAPLTDDEKAADEKLVRIAHSLQSANLTPEQLLRTGLPELLADVQFCEDHMCRPSKYAEHASTAADFFFQVQAFPEAEQVLDKAIQAAQRASNFNLEATLVNNMGTVLRKQRKFKRALSLHRQHMATVIEKHGLDSQYVVLARNNLVEVLEVLKMRDDALELLRDQAQQCLTRAEQAETAKASTAAEGEGTEADAADKTAAAWASTARCYLDLARFTSRRGGLAEAAEHARTALSYARRAHGKDQAGIAVYLSFLGGNLKLQAERSRSKEHMREARDVFQELTSLIEAAEPLSRNLPALHRTLAELSMDLGEHDEAYKHGQRLVSVMAHIVGGNHYHPNLQAAWHFIEQLHVKGGDTAGAEAARKAILKCKASGMRSRDGSHKSKQTAAPGGRGRPQQRRRP